MSLAAELGSDQMICRDIEPQGAHGVADLSWAPLAIPAPAPQSRLG